MKKIISRALACLIFLSFFMYGSAQTLSNEDIKAQMVKDWQRAKAYTIEYLNTMPADKYSFKAVDSIRSFAQQMIHLAQGNYFLMSNATDQQMPAWMMSDPEHRNSAQVKDSVMYYVISSYDFCINGVQNSDVNKWGEMKKVRERTGETRFALMNKAYEHQTHHRGQTTIYIRLLGIRPPQEQLF